MEEPQKVLTWQELKDFCSTLNPEQLARKVYIWVGDDEIAKEVNCAETLGDDMYYFIDHEYSCSAKDFDKHIMCNDDTFEDAIALEEHQITTGDHAYLHAFEF
jgi:hypothetical protein